MQEKIIEKLIGNAPLLILLIGVIVFAIGAAGGLPIGDPPLQVHDSGWRLALGGMGALLAAAGLLLVFRDSALGMKSSKGMDLFSNASLPQELSQSYLQRKAGLTPSQSNLLYFIERAFHDHDAVSQDEIEAQFQDMTKSEVYYRVEHLRLLGFLEKRPAGADKHRFGRFSYQLSASYKKEIGPVLAVA